MDRLPTGELPGDTAQQLANHWDYIDRQGQKLREWRQRNPQPEYGDPAAQQWWSDLNAMEKRLGLPPDYSHDRLRTSGGRAARSGSSALCIDLGRQTCEHLQLPDGLNRLSRCRACDGLFLTTRLFGGRQQCSAACDAVAVDQIAERKRQQRRQRSTELASRTGRCRVCGELFQVKRKTARTCSERCKKQAQRHPERYAITGPPTHLEPEDCELSLDRLLEIATTCHEASRAALGFSLTEHPSERDCYRHDGGAIPLEQYVEALQQTWVTASGSPDRGEVEAEQSRAAAMLRDLQLFKDAPAVWLAGQSPGTVIDPHPIG